MNAIPLPPPSQLARAHKGQRRAALIRRLYAERCSPQEIAEWVGVSVADVRRTVLRPVRPSTWTHSTDGQSRDKRGRWLRK